MCDRMTGVPAQSRRTDAPLTLAGMLLPACSTAIETMQAAVKISHPPTPLISRINSIYSKVS